MTTPINILETALAVNGGEPETITLDGVDLTIRKNYTGAEVHEMLRWINAESDGDAQLTIEEQMTGMYSLLSTDKAAQVKKYVTKLLSFKVVEMKYINTAVFQVAGLADEKGNFLGGV
ncbi:hypothetical protein QVA66_03955 [Staphylococcus chromogenes]|nr:hypothetical protein [Staphylococcus chromogenes]